MVLSLGASHLGRVLWEKWPGSEDLLFSELMIWGYLHRVRSQRRLASALDTLGPMSETRRGRLDGMSTKERAKLLEQLVAEMETRDPYLHGHSRRVARYSWMIARRLGLPREEVARIRTAAAIHDVGKIKTPKAILHKAGRLTDAEYEVIKRHPGDGAVMADVLGDPELTSMVRHHHERLDGTGYPDGQSGQQIPLGARIIAVADTFDAITSERPYRSASPHKRAIDILREEAGTRLDPGVVRAFCGHYAGRRPLAAWAFVAGLPERVLSWLVGSAASVGSAAKVVAVAALVGGAAVSSSTLGLPAVKHRAVDARSESTAASHAQGASSTTPTASIGQGAGATAGAGHHSARSRHAALSPAAGSGAQTGAASGAQPSDGGGSSTQGAGSAAAEGAVAGKGETAKGKSEEGSAKGTPESPSKGKSEEGTAKAKTEEAKGKGEEGTAKAKTEEAKGKSEEGTAKAKTEEAKGKSEEGTAKAKTEEVAGKTKEVLGKTKEVVKEVVKEVKGGVEGVLGKLK